MKRSALLFMPILLMLASCGTPAQYSQQRFPDSIYLLPGEGQTVTRPLYSEEDFERMAANEIARKQGRDTLVVIVDDPWDYGWYNRYNRFYFYSPRWSSWAWSLGVGPFWGSRFYTPGWIDPWYDLTWGFYDYGYYPWSSYWYSRYYSPWGYDPWYAYYNPWYYSSCYGYGDGDGYL